MILTRISIVVLQEPPNFGAQCFLLHLILGGKTHLFLIHMPESLVLKSHVRILKVGLDYSEVVQQSRILG